MPIVLVVLAYLLGSLSFSYWIVKAALGIDVRTVGSRSAGATNVLRTAGRGPAVLALALDVAKGVAAVALARYADVDTVVVGVAAVAVVCGHIYPIYSGFHGGKGVATAAGALGVLSPLVCISMLFVFAGVVAIWRYVSLGSILSALFFPLGLYLLSRFGWVESDGVGWLLLSSLAIALLIVFRHRENMVRLWQGSENKLGGSVAKT